MKPPRRFRVGPYSYRLEMRHGGDELGLTDLNMLTVNIRAELAADLTRETVLHEVLHTITDMIGERMRLGSDREEEIIRSLSPALLMVLRDNPKLVAYLLSD